MTDLTINRIKVTAITADLSARREMLSRLDSLFEVNWIPSTRQYKHASQTKVMLIDINSSDIKSISELSQQHPELIIAFFQVTELQSVFPYLCINGVNGMFSRYDRAQVLQKGLVALQNGELFFPRDIMRLLIERVKLDPTHASTDFSVLSKKERQILKVLAQGMTNNDIASEMNLSFHTVKTHVYNIYKKLNVSNRAEATRLAQSALIQ